MARDPRAAVKKLAAAAEAAGFTVTTSTAHRKVWLEIQRPDLRIVALISSVSSSSG